MGQFVFHLRPADQRLPSGLPTTLHGTVHHVPERRPTATDGSLALLSETISVGPSSFGSWWFWGFESRLSFRKWPTLTGKPPNSQVTPSWWFGDLNPRLSFSEANFYREATQLVVWGFECPVFVEVKLE